MTNDAEKMDSQPSAKPSPIICIGCGSPFSDGRKMQTLCWDCIEDRHWLMRKLDLFAERDTGS